MDARDSPGKGKEKRMILSKNAENGSVTIEYTLTCFLSAAIMAGIKEMFERVSLEVMQQFYHWINLSP